MKKKGQNHNIPQLLGSALRKPTKQLLIVFILICPSIISAQPLDTLLQWSEENNPNLESLDLYYQAALEEKNAVNQLPDPTVGVGIPVLRPETRLGAQVMTIGVTQMFPWKGTLKAKADVIELNSKTKFQEINMRRLDIQYEVKSSYYELQLIDKKQTILSEFNRNYNALRNITLTKVENGKSSAADVLQIDLKINEINNRIQVMENEKEMHYGKINALINQNQGQQINVDPLPESPAIINYDLAQFQTQIRTSHPLLLQMDWKIAASRQSQMINELSAKPTFGLGLDYSLVKERSDAEPSHNGRDILIPKAMISIPIFQDKFKSLDQKAVLEQRAVTNEKQSVENQMIGMLQGYKSRYDIAMLNLQFYEQQASTISIAYDLLLSEYSSKDIRFDELLQLQNEQINFKLMVADAIAQTYIHQSAIEKLTQYK